MNSHVYLRGSYLKFSRNIGQSPWSVNGVKICDSSVQEEMSKTLIDIFQCEGCVMSAGGREDIDVRMLGSGRPFIMEIANPKFKNKPLENIQEIQDKINANTVYIQVKNLTLCDRNYYAVVKKYEDSKQKFYTCLVCTEKPITDEDLEKLNAVRNLNLVQKTPMRVMHRRTLLDRNKTIFKIDAERINETFLIVSVLASAGTYIKEFIHSDLGRTSPSLVEMLKCDCDILQLDVLDIVYEN
jgi:tRNA pseudouridine synthase 10